MHDYVIVRHSRAILRAILRCQKMQGRYAVQYGQALVAKKPEPSAAQGLRDSKIPHALPCWIHMLLGYTQVGRSTDLMKFGLVVSA